MRDFGCTTSSPDYYSVENSTKMMYCQKQCKQTMKFQQKYVPYLFIYIVPNTTLIQLTNGIVETRLAFPRAIKNHVSLTGSME